MGKGLGIYREFLGPGESGRVGPVSPTRKYRGLKNEYGAPEGIRTPGLCLRRAALYPAELRAQIPGYSACVQSRGG